MLFLSLLFPCCWFLPPSLFVGNSWVSLVCFCFSVFPASIVDIWSTGIGDMNGEHARMVVSKGVTIQLEGLHVGVHAEMFLSMFDAEFWSKNNRKADKTKTRSIMWPPSSKLGREEENAGSQSQGAAKCTAQLDPTTNTRGCGEMARSHRMQRCRGNRTRKLEPVSFLSSSSSFFLLHIYLELFLLPLCAPTPPCYLLLLVCLPSHSSTSSVYSLFVSFTTTHSCIWSPQK